MSLWAVAQKAARQQRRDRLGTALTLLTAPCFVFLYWVFFAQHSAAPGLALVQPVPAGLEAALRDAGLDPQTFASPQEARLALEQGALGALLLPQAPQGQITRWEVQGDASAPGWSPLLLTLHQVALAQERQGRPEAPRVQLQPRALGHTGARTPFEAYVPNLMVFAVVMLVFSSSMAVARESEAGTLDRLRMTPLGAPRLLAGVSLVQLALGAASVALTFGAAALLGFESQGSIWLAIGLGACAGAGSVGLGMAVASVSTSVARAFVLSSVVMFLLMLFSGVVFPVPEITWMELGGHRLGPFSLLPTTHAAQALRKVLLLGQSLPQVAFELVMMLALSALGFTLGAALWTWRHGRAAHLTEPPR